MMCGYNHPRFPTADRREANYRNRTQKGQFMAEKERPGKEAHRPVGGWVPAVPETHPPAIWFFFWGEFAERSSFYGMRAILPLYMAQALHMAATTATPLYNGFKMACYFLPLVGGFIADRFLGRYWTIVGFSIPYVAGHFILGIPNYVSMVFALALLAGGSGVIKPNISTLMGQTYDQLRPGKERLRAAAFLWFYMSINIGAFVSTLALPAIRSNYIESHMPASLAEQAKEMAAKGEDIAKIAPDDVVQSAYAVAFAFPAWLMVLSLGIFAAGKRFYALEQPERHVLTPEERRLQWQTLVRLFGIFGLVVLFWFGYEHSDSIWVYFTRDYVDLKLRFSVPFLGDTIPPDQVQALNPLFVIILIPVFNGLFGWLDPRVKIFTAMRKILAGFILTAAAIGVMSWAGYRVEGHTEQIMRSDKLVEVSTEKVSILWPVIAYIVLTIGEVLLYGTMLELAYAAAPKSMKGFVTACFLVTNTLGNFLNMLWTPYYGGSLVDKAADRGSLLPGPFFGITAGVVVFAAVAFYFVGKQFERTQAQAAAAGVT
jgi:POT family proton-dependent oligopeptide transporter